MSAALEVRNLVVSFGSLKIVDDVSFSLEPGRWLMIVGPNGAGKSTIVNAVTRGVSHEGTVLVNGRDVSRMKPRELAKSVGVLSQGHSVSYPFTVNEVVRLGRYAYSKGALSQPDMSGEDAVKRALELTGLSKIAEQPVLTLSGGELQRTFLAQLFAQDPGLLILDEPTNHLDLVYQKQVFGLIKKWIADTGRAVASVVHDLSLARTYGDDALLLDGGKKVAHGTVREVLTRERLQGVYRMDVYEWMRDMLSQWEE